MKSAYELAMERLEKTSPQMAVTEEQKNAIAAIDEKFRAKVAEKEVFLGDLLAKAVAEGNALEAAQLEEQRSREIGRLREQCEAEKEKIRKSGEPG